MRPPLASMRLPLPQLASVWQPLALLNRFLRCGAPRAARAPAIPAPLERLRQPLAPTNNRLQETPAPAEEVAQEVEEAVEEGMMNRRPRRR